MKSSIVMISKAKAITSGTHLTANAQQELVPVEALSILVHNVVHNRQSALAVVQVLEDAPGCMYAGHIIRGLQ
jgi:hypothetical protein